MFRFILIFLVLIICHFTFGQHRIEGKLVDVKAIPIPNAIIYIQNTTRSSLSNEEGFFSIECNLGDTLVVQHLSYKALKSPLTSYKTLVLVLEDIDQELKEVVINAGLDPSIAIIKKAISNKKKFKQSTLPYEVDLYTKGILKLKEVPQKILGQKIGNMDGVLDSARSGILYLSESLSKINNAPPNLYKERLLASKVSGQSTGISSNQFNYANFNFYNDYITMDKAIVSPLADNAFSYYDYFLYESKFDPISKITTHKIKTKPKSINLPCFSGFIYINDSLYNIHSLDLNLYSKAMDNPTLDSFNVKQVFLNVNGNQWYLASQTLQFKINIFLIRAYGTFNYLFKDYKFKDLPPLSFFDSEIFTAKDATIVNSDTFWIENRPIALTVEEDSDYQKKDSLEILQQQPSYLDSIDRSTNKFKLKDVLLGYDGMKSKHNLEYGFYSILTNIAFNPVEGTNFSFKPYIKKNDKLDGFNVWETYGILRYGGIDKRLKLNLNYQHTLNQIHLTKIFLEAGSGLRQYNEDPIISEWGNTWRSLLLKDNQAKWFQKNFITLGLSSEIRNGVRAKFTMQFADRKALANNTEYSFRSSKFKNYLPNNPFNDDPFTLDNKILKLDFRISLSPFQKYNSYPRYRNRRKSAWPDFIVDMTYAPSLGGKYVHYSKLKLTITDQYLNWGTKGYISYKIDGGIFLNKSKVSPIDMFHFQEYNGFQSNYTNKLKLVQYYQFSTKDWFSSVGFEHHLNGFINKRLPLIKNTRLTGIYSCSAVLLKDTRYIEPGIGIEGFKYGPIELMRIDYYWGIKNGKLWDQCFKIGLSTTIENIIKR